MEARLPAAVVQVEHAVPLHLYLGLVQLLAIDAVCEWRVANDLLLATSQRPGSGARGRPVAASQEKARAELLRS